MVCYPGVHKHSKLVDQQNCVSQKQNGMQCAVSLVSYHVTAALGGLCVDSVAICFLAEAYEKEKQQTGAIF